MDSGSNDWVYWQILQLQTIVTTHTLNSFWMLMTPVWLMLYEKSLPNDHSHIFFLHNFVRTEYRSPYPTVHFIACLFVVTETRVATCYLATTRSLLFVAAGTWYLNRCSAMDIRSGFTISAFKRCLPSRCLAIDYSVTKYVIYKYVLCHESRY
jgi:hypothetical protein